MSTNIVDIFLLFNFIKRLVLPFRKWRAYHLGVIDADGQILIPPKERTKQQKASFQTFDVLVRNLKLLLGKIPGGSSPIASLGAALLLLKEHRDGLPDGDLASYLTEAIVLVTQTPQFATILIREDGEPVTVVGSGHIAGTDGTTGPARLSRKVLVRNLQNPRVLGALATWKKYYPKTSVRVSSRKRNRARVTTEDTQHLLDVQEEVVDFLLNRLDQRLLSEAPIESSLLHVIPDYLKTIADYVSGAIDPNDVDSVSRHLSQVKEILKKMRNSGETPEEHETKFVVDFIKDRRNARAFKSIERNLKQKFSVSPYDALTYLTFRTKAKSPKARLALDIHNTVVELKAKLREIQKELADPHVSSDRRKVLEAQKTVIQTVLDEYGSLFRR